MEPPVPNVFVLVVFFIACTMVLRKWYGIQISRPVTRLPPGPMGLPFIGNAFDIPAAYSWITYSEMAKKYGSIVSFRILGFNFIILNSALDVRDILVKRGHLCAARIQYVMYEHAGWENDIHVVGPDSHRVMKRFAAKHFAGSAVPILVDASNIEVVQAVVRMLWPAGSDGTTYRIIDPENCLRRMVGSLLLRLGYGYEVTSDDDPFLKAGKEAFGYAIELATPGWILDVLPWMRHLPGWMMGPTFVRTVARSRELVHVTRTSPIEWTKRQLEAGTARPSLAGDLLQASNKKDNELLFVLLADMYIGGMETTIAACLTLIFMLALHPEVQIKAQQEIDCVTHGARLPVYDDRPRLPYVCAVIMEVYRINGIVNLGVPRRTTQGMEYKGYLIPKNTIICANIWSILHDPIKYPDPFTFNPERFFAASTVKAPNDNSEVINEDPTRYIFGKCLGYHIAEVTVFLFATSMLASNRVSDVVDTKGAPLSRNDIAFTGSMAASRPFPFMCLIEPRDNAQDLLLA